MTTLQKATAALRSDPHWPLHLIGLFRIIFACTLLIAAFRTGV